MRGSKQTAARLADVPLFGRCDRHDLRMAARYIEVVTVASGVEVVTQGDTGEALYLLLDGSAMVVRDGVEVGRLGRGDYFGELALLDSSPRAATVTTAEESTVAVLGVRMFRVLLRELPALAAELLADLALQARNSGTITEQPEAAPAPPT